MGVKFCGALLLLVGFSASAVAQTVETLNGSSTNSFVVPNLTLTTRDLHNGVSLSASVYNLFNSQYGYPGGDEHRQNIIFQDGRTFRVGLRYTWRAARARP
jgi:outer membrane receptor protein involved in Fe transport